MRVSRLLITIYKENVSFQTRPPGFQPHTHVHAYHEGSGFKNPNLVPWLAMGGTWDLDPDDFLLRGFFGFFFLRIGPCGPVPPPPLEWTPFPPLIAAVVITPKGAESPGSRRIGVIGAMVLILPSKTV